MLTSERRSVYLDARMHALNVDNPHFDFRDEYDAALRSGGATEHFCERLRANFFTAVSEDVLRKGNFTLEYYEGDNGRPMLTTEDHKSFGDLTVLTLRGVKKRREEGKSYARELAELAGIRELRRNALDCPHDTRFVLIYPPGPKEDGYSGVSLTYIYRVDGDPGPGRRLRGMFYKNALTLEGHEELFYKLTRDSAADPDLSPEFFVSHPVDISDHPMVQTEDDVIAAIDQIAESGTRFVDREIGFGSLLSAETFSLYEPQLQASAAFLTEVFGEKISMNSTSLNQKTLSDLELAYSFARRAVTAFAQRGTLISAEDLLKDYRWRQNVEEPHKDVPPMMMDGIASELVRLQEHFLDRYGDLDQQRVGGFGCPPGMISAIGVSLDGFTIPGIDGVTFGTSEKNWSYHSGTCRVCQSENTMVGPCDICKPCERTFD